MIGERAQFDAHAAEPVVGEPGGGDIILKIAALVSEIDALKRERHAEPVLDARVRLAANYFEKRRPTAVQCRPSSPDVPARHTSKLGGGPS
jgi:hypothetical protein